MAKRKAKRKAMERDPEREAELKAMAALLGMELRHSNYNEGRFDLDLYASDNCTFVSLWPKERTRNSRYAHLFIPFSRGGNSTTNVKEFYARVEKMILDAARGVKQ